MNKNYNQGKMSKKELENKINNNSPKGESFHDSQTESDSNNTNQKSSNIDNPAIKDIKDNNNSIDKPIKEEQSESNDHIAYDKKYWNINDLQYNDLYLRREGTYESKLSIDTPDVSKQRLKEYLNEDLLNALDVSPMVTPKNMLKDAAVENINENNNENNNENIIHISDDMMTASNNDLFQFSLYSNNNSANPKNEKENNSNNNNNLKNNPIDELIKISENNNEDKNKIKNQKEEEEFNDNGIMESFMPSHLNMNINMQSPNTNTIKIFNNNNNINDNKINIKTNDINNKNEIRNIIEDEGGGGNIKKDKQDNKNNPNKININNANININLNNNNTNNINNLNINNNNNTNNNNINYNKFSQNIDNKKETETKKINNNTNTTKNYIPSHMQNPYIAHMPFPYQTPQHIIQALQSNIHENKFDGNKKFNIIIPMQPMKKSTKMKKPFEIRDGDWTCSDCGNLNFAFRVRCNRCGISKEASEEKKLNNNDAEQKNNNTKDVGNNNNTNNNTNNNNNNNNINNTKNYYPNVNMMQYKGLIFHNPLYNKGEAYYPKYYQGFIYVPVQGNYMKDTQEKKNIQTNKEIENLSVNNNNNKKNDETNIKNEKKEEDKKDESQKTK